MVEEAEFLQRREEFQVQAFLREAALKIPMAEAAAGPVWVVVGVIQQMAAMEGAGQ
jgi:hypothetical protein